MKFLKVSLMITLICKASIGLSINVNFNQSQSCCSEISEITDDKQEQENTKGCCDQVCDCLCCGHIFTFNRGQELKPFKQVPYVAFSHSYSFQYRHALSTIIWQPPRYC